MHKNVEVEIYSIHNISIVNKEGAKGAQAACLQ